MEIGELKTEVRMNKYKVTLEGLGGVTVVATGFVVTKDSIDFYYSFEMGGQDGTLRIAKPENIAGTFRRSSVIAFWPEDAERDMTFEVGIEDLFK